MKKLRKSFTLIELLIVLVIIGVITVLALPKLERIVLKANMMRRVPVLDAIRKAELAYYAETGKYWWYNIWSEGNDPAYKQNLGLDLPVLKDSFYHTEASFCGLNKIEDGVSACIEGDSRLAGYFGYIYSSAGMDGDGPAWVIMCVDESLNVKKLCIKYGVAGVDITTAPIEDIVVK